MDDSSGLHTIQLKDNLSLADLYIQKTGEYGDVELRINGNDQDILKIRNFADFFTNWDGANHITKSRRNMRLRLADGHTVEVSDVTSPFRKILGTEADNRIGAVLDETATTIYGFAGKDRLSGNSGDDMLYGGNDDDELYGNKGDDKLYGEDGNDALYGNDGKDVLVGAEGEDKLYGGAGDDVLDGGTGNDRLDGAEGNDVYLFQTTHGQDTLYDSLGMNTIQFPDQVKYSDIIIRRTSKNIVLSYKDNDDSITFENFAERPESRNFILKFSDGTTQTIDSLNSIFRNLTGTAADETIDLFLSDGGTIHAGAGDDTLNGSAGADTLYGEDGDDTINGGSGNDTIIGGAGDDTLKGGDDKDDHDVYLFGRGHGKDYLYDEYGTSTIRFTDDIVSSDFLVRRDGQHIVLMNQVSGDQLTIAYFASHSTHRRVILEFSDGTVHTIDNQDSIFRNLTGTAADETIDLILSDGGTIRAGAGNDTLNGSNGADTLYGEDGDDTINGGSGNDTIIGGAGDDNLYGGDGDDIYVFGRGHGKDRISDSSGHTTVSFQSGISADALRVSREGSDLVLSSSETDSIRLSNYHSSSSARDVSMLFADQSTAVINQTDWTLNVTPASLEAKAFSVEDQVRGARAVLEDAGNTEIVADGMAPTDLSVADQEAAYKAQLATQLLSSLPDRNAAPDTLNSNLIATEELYTEQFTLGA